MHFPEQPLDWEYLLDILPRYEVSDFSYGGQLYQERVQFLSMCGMSSGIESLGFKIWRDDITNITFHGGATTWIFCVE
jgi:hypothetical protein